MFDGALVILAVPPFLGIEYKLLTASFASFVFGNPAVAKSMRVIVPFISVLVRTVKKLIVLAIMCL